MPVAAIIMVALAIGFAIYSVINTKKRMVAAEAQNSASRAGELAPTMGLELVEGDPLTNLAYARALTASHKGEVPEIKVRLEGDPGGRRTQLLYYDRTKVETGLTSTTYTTWLTAELTVQVHAPFPEFEVLMRNPRELSPEIKPKLNAAPISFADPALSEFFILKSADPRVAPVIAEALRPLVGWGWVQIHGQGDKITFHWTKSTVGYLGMAVQVQRALNELAASLEQAAAAHGA